MKPTSLNPGDRVQFRDLRHVLQFVRREPGGPAMCIVESADLGTVAATDADVVRRCELAQPESRPQRAHQWQPSRAPPPARGRGQLLPTSAQQAQRKIPLSFKQYLIEL